MVRSGTNDEVLARVPAAGARTFDQGDEVALAWDSDAVAVFADE
ncbi:MAG: TOBE domain-containing protein [Brevibacterium sp.]|nr:TOBE domain-containing protein [Brevibacterium sp.]